MRSRQWRGWLILGLLVQAACELQPGPTTNPVQGDANLGTPAEVIAHARELIRTDKLQEARELLDKHIAANPSDATAFHLRGIAWMREGIIYAAVKDLNAAAQIAPSTDIYYNLGNALQQGGYFDRAETAYRAALETAPDDPEILNNLAGALIYQLRHDEAIGLLERVTELRPNDPEAFCNLGIAYARIDDFAAAEAQLGRALAIDAKYYPAVYNLAQIFLSQNREEEAARQFIRYLELRPDAPDRTKIEGRIKSALGEDAI